MNEITKSVLRRVGYQSDMARTKSTDFGEMEITVSEFRSIISEIEDWPRAYPFMIDGVKIKVLWDKKCPTT